MFNIVIKPTFYLIGWQDEETRDNWKKLETNWTGLQVSVSKAWLLKTEIALVSMFVLKPFNELNIYQGWFNIQSAV